MFSHRNAGHVGLWLRMLVIVLFLSSVLHFIWAFYEVSNAGISHLGQLVPDFAWYYFAFRDIWVHDAYGLYNVAVQHAWLAAHHLTNVGKNLYAYPPLFAVLFSPLGLLSLPWAFWTWNILNALCYFGLLWLIGRWATESWVYRLLIDSLALMTYPLFENFFMGQVDVMLALLIGAGMYEIYGRSHDMSGGILIGLAACLKITPAIFLVFWLLQRRWRIVQGGILVTVISLALTLLIVPFNAYLYYVFHTLAQVNAVDFKYGGAPWNGSFKGIIMATRLRAFAPATGWVAGIGTLGMFFLYFERRLSKTRNDPRLTAGFLSLLVLFASPVVEIHTWNFVAIPLILASGYWLDRPSKSRDQIASFIILLAAWMLFIIPDTLTVLPAVNGPYLVRQSVAAGIFSHHKIIAGYVPLPMSIGSILIAIQHMFGAILGAIAIFIGLRHDHRTIKYTHNRWNLFESTNRY